MTPQRLLPTLARLLPLLLLSLALPSAVLGQSSPQKLAPEARARLAQASGDGAWQLTQTQGYDPADMAGTWECNSLASGPGAPWWTRVHMDCQPDGGFDFVSTYSDGGGNTGSGVLSLSSEGVLTSPGGSGRGVLDAGKTVAVTTDTWPEDGTTELQVWTRMAATYALPDLVGTWEVNSLASGYSAPWWERAQGTVAPDGSFSGSSTNSGGGGNERSGTIGITLDGVVAGGSSRGVLDAGKTVMVATDTWTGWGAGATELRVWTKMAGTYSLSDLVGTWEINSLAAGPGTNAHWWERTCISVTPDGSYVGTVKSSSGDSVAISGALDISAGGVVTIPGSSSFRGVLDAHKTVLVATDMRGDGSALLQVGTRMALPPLAVDDPAAYPLLSGLRPPAPNPTRGTTSVSYAIAQAGRVQLGIYDVSGRLVRRLVDGVRRAGTETVAWNGTDASGARLGAGLYFVRLTAPGLTETRRVILLH